jgi:hypothetical protein
MKGLLRFKPVEIDSKVYFTGRKKKMLKYPVRSVSLEPIPGSPNGQKVRMTVPEIFWQ